MNNEGNERRIINPMYDEIGIGGEPYKKDDWKKIAIHSETEIHGFFDQYRFLSNTWPAEVEYEGLLYPSIENAYQAAKFKIEDRSYFTTCTPKESKIEADTRPMVFSSEDWDVKRNDVMYALLEHKFSPIKHPELSRQLKETAGKHLEETNWWNDKYWGVCYGVGENNLGKMLMKIRATL